MLPARPEAVQKIRRPRSKTVRSRSFSTRPLGDFRAQKGRHPLPREIRACHIVSRAALIGKGMRRVVAIDLLLDAGTLQYPFEIVHRRRSTPIVPVSEMALQR